MPLKKKNSNLKSLFLDSWNWVAPWWPLFQSSINFCSEAYVMADTSHYWWICDDDGWTAFVKNSYKSKLNIYFSPISYVLNPSLLYPLLCWYRFQLSSASLDIALIVVSYLSLFCSAASLTRWYLFDWEGIFSLFTASISLYLSGAVMGAYTNVSEEAEYHDL